jgi:acetylornithine deacetylase
MKTIEKKIIDIIEKNKQEIISFTQDLIRIPTENKQTIGNEKECQEFVSGKMKEWGFEVDMFTPVDAEGIEMYPLYRPGRDFENRPNVVAAYRGNDNGRSLIFSGHIDVGAKEPMLWSHEPFGAEIEKGRIYGRGSLDMKGGLAAAIMAAKTIIDSGITLKGDLFIESVVDEEGSGAGSLACILKGYKADAVIIPEPTCMKVCPASLGEQSLRITITSDKERQYLGGGPINSNPVYGIARIINALAALNEKRCSVALEHMHPLYRNTVNPISLSIEQLKAGEIGVPGAFGLPVDCWASVSFRVFPGTTEEDFKKEFFEFIHTTVDKEPSLKRNPPVITEEAHFLRPHEIPENHPIMEEISRSCELATRKKADREGAPFACDAYLFDHYGNMPTVIYGPGGDNAHGPDEYVNIKDLISLCKIYAITILNWCG